MTSMGGKAFEVFLIRRETGWVDEAPDEVHYLARRRAVLEIDREVLLCARVSKSNKEAYDSESGRAGEQVMAEDEPRTLSQMAGWGTERIIRVDLGIHDAVVPACESCERR